MHSYKKKSRVKKNQSFKKTIHTWNDDDLIGFVV